MNLKDAMDTSVLPTPLCMIPGCIQFFGVVKLTTKKDLFMAFTKIH